ncbi:PAS domain S-box protein [Halomicrobium katesii]|uniref:PAS domain S-box protein n=1 Tax=Halomicrobium katesii TaxID=437163 RepID=UPI0003638584|nr:PAS domain S-box protein [Halomicrobium katesii]
MISLWHDVVPFVGAASGEWFFSVSGGVTGVDTFSIAFVLTGLVGLAVRGDADDPIAQLTEKVRRVAAGADDVTFTTDRDDEIGALYDAIDDLVTATDAEDQTDETFRRSIYEITSDPALDDDAKLDRLLELGCERLGVETGFIAQIDQADGRYEIERATGPLVAEESVFDLSETLCRRTITSDDVLGIADTVATSDLDDSEYADSDVRSYIGSKLLVDGELYGTLCFVGSEPRERPFSHAEKVFVDLVGRWISQTVERRERMETLERHASMLDSLFEELPVSLYVKDEAGRHLRKSVSDRVTEFPDDEEWYRGKTDLDIYDEALAERTYADDMQVIESGEPIRKTEQYDPRAEEWVLTSKVPWRGPDGEVRGLIGVTQYITERKEYERKLEAIVQNTTNQIYIKDSDGVYQFVNEATAELFDREPAEILGKRDDELFDSGTIEALISEDRHVLSSGETVTTTTTAEIDGERRTFLDNKYPYRDESGEIIGVMGISNDITERQARERKLRERKRELATLMSNLPGMVYRCRNEPDWPFEFVSEGCRELTGYEPAAIRSGDVNWGEDVIVGDNDELWETVQRAVDDHEQFEVTYPIETADGQRRWLWERGVGIYDDDGTVRALEGVVTDVTDRKARQRELRRTNERLNTLIDASPDALILIDTDGVVELWNPAAERIFGWSEAEVVGDTLPFVPADRESEFDGFRERLLSGESISSVETRRRRTDGTLIDVSLSAAPLRDVDGEITGIMAVMEDITERKRQERQLREHQRELDRYREFTEDILDAVDDVFYVLDEDGSLQRWNSAHTQVTGYSDAEIESMHATDFFAPEHRSEIEAAIEETKATGDAVVEVPYLTKDGEQVPHEFVAVALEDPDGNQLVAGIGRDISERKRRERQLERTTDLLSRAEEMAAIGGWAAVVEDGAAVDTTWTDKLFDIFGLADGEARPVEAMPEFYHPDDRERHRDAIERALDHGIGWEQELRLDAPDGTQRWVHTIGEPVLEDGTVVELRGSVQDITAQKQRELALESLHDSARGLLTTESIDDATRLIVDTAASLLDQAAVGIYLYDETTNLLEPASVSPGFEALCGGEPDAVGPGTESFLWHAYVTGTQSVLEGVDTSGESGPFVDAVDTGIVVPIGSHGVFAALDEAGEIGERDRSLVETLVATAAAAFERLESEATLREREAEIEAQNERLRRQIRANETIRSVDQALIGATDRDQLEAAVCERLVDDEDISFAWIGSFDPGGETLQARAWAGAGESYLDTPSFDRSATHSDPAVSAALDDEPVAVSNIARNVQQAAWRRAALAVGHQSALAVPVSLDDYQYGVLAVYADEPDVFGEFETAVFAELGTSIANAITSITTRQALNADTLTALELRVEDTTDPLLDIAFESGCTVTYEGVGTVSSDETRLFVRVSGCAPATVSELLADRHTIADHHLVSESEDGGVFEVTIRGETVLARLARQGGRVRKIAAEGSGIDIEVDVPTSVDVRSFVETLTDDGTVELVSRRERARSSESDPALAETILGALTDRQREVLRTGYFSGFFNWPRDTTGQELAAMLDVSQPTVNRHLRLGQQRIMRQLFDDEPEAE